MFKHLLPVLAVAAIALFAACLPAQKIVSLTPTSSNPSSNLSEPTFESDAMESDTIESDAATDQVALPPNQQTFTATPYRLTITAVDNWLTPAASSHFYEGDTLLWQREIPHQYGPRYTLISPNGQVLLLDEFLNIASPHALTLLNVAGEEIARYSFDEIQETLAISAAELTQQASSGWWISAEPIFDDSGDFALVQTGGITLEVDLSTGELTTGSVTSPADLP